MKASPIEEVRDMYEASADSYAAMMDSEIDLPIYKDTLGRLSTNIADTPGALIDTSCGSGHMLSMYRECYDRERALVGIDLSPRMVSIASTRLGAAADVVLGDMRDLDMVDAGKAAAVMSFFSIHHLDARGVRCALREWHRVTRASGQLLLAAWEGVGTIDYGDVSDVVAFRYANPELNAWIQEAGFAITRNVVEPVEGMTMDAIVLEGTRVG